MDEADAWIVKLRSDSVSVEDKELFSSWLNSSSAHVEAFDRSYAAWETLAAAAYLPGVEAMERGENPDSKWDKIAKTLTHLKSQLFGPWQLGAAVACLFAFFFVALGFVSEPSEQSFQRFVSAVGQTSVVALEDGSVLELNTNTTVEVSYSQSRRELRLLSGEAYFQVAHDRARPFVVDFGRGSATAVGTAFNIYRQENNSSVTVTEGIVDVREAPDLAIPNPEPVRVRVDQQIDVGQRGVGPVKNANTSRLVAWRDKTVIFRNTSLAKAIGELNRYLETPVYTDDSNLNELKVSGTFSLNAPTETLDALVTAFDLSKIESASGNRLYLRNE